MKHLLTTIGLIAAVLVLSSTGALAADLEYTPDSSSLTITPGDSQRTPLTIHLNDSGYTTYFLWFIDQVEGNLPMSWLSASPDISFISQFWNDNSTNITVTVPSDAGPGLYSGVIYSKAMGSHGLADPGAGFYLEVVVPSNCSSNLKIDSFGPEVIWPPNHSMKNVEIKGEIEVTGGCSLYQVGYVVEDEYDELNSTGTITLPANSNKFSVAVPVEASRLGQDKDGRHYTITIYVETDAGISTSEPLEVVVPHDRRDIKK